MQFANKCKITKTIESVEVNLKIAAINGVKKRDDDSPYYSACNFVLK